MIKASDLMRRLSTLLLDDEHIRWPLNELADWINEAVRAICLAKPSTASRSTIIPLQLGTLQKVPQTITDKGDTPLSLMRLVRNINDKAQPHLGGSAITIVSGTTLDAQVPQWHDRHYLPFSTTVRHYIYDEANPLEFYVYPGNDGSGHVEAIIAFCPASITAQNDGSHDTDWANATIALPELWSIPIVDYAMYRALTKDDLNGSPARAAAHYQQFATAIGQKIDVEGASSPNTKRLTRQ